MLTYCLTPLLQIRIKYSLYYLIHSGDPRTPVHIPDRCPFPCDKTGSGGQDREPSSRFHKIQVRDNLSIKQSYSKLFDIDSSILTRKEYIYMHVEYRTHRFANLPKISGWYSICLLIWCVRLILSYSLIVNVVLWRNIMSWIRYFFKFNRFTSLCYITTEHYQNVYHWMSIVLIKFFPLAIHICLQIFIYHMNVLKILYFLTSNIHFTKFVKSRRRISIGVLYPCQSLVVVDHILSRKSARYVQDCWDGAQC